MRVWPSRKQSGISFEIKADMVVYPVTLSLNKLIYYLEMFQNIAEKNAATDPE